jgi:predicted enzyme related to lactoylglutathione lyase
MRLSSVMIGSEEPKVLADYYTQVFGEPRWNDGGYVGWQFDGTTGMAVGPHDKVTGRNAQPGRMIWNLESSDVAADFARLKDAGATVVQEPYEAAGEGSGMWVATFADPDDNYFQLMSPMEPPA